MVDDDAFIVTVVEAFLKQLGYKALAATSGREALQLFDENRDQTSLVILDQSMPDISGAELAAQLRSMRPSLPIIMFSGYGEEDMRRATRHLGISAFMPKPVTGDQLAVTVRRALDTAREKENAH